MGAAWQGVEKQGAGLAFWGHMRYLNRAVKHWMIAAGVGHDKSLRRSKNAI